MNCLRNFGMRLLCLLLGAVCLGAMALQAGADDSAQDLPAYTSFVHTSPYDGSYAFGQLSSGTRLTVLDETRDYLKIDCGGHSGYLAKTHALQDDQGYIVKTVPGSSDSTQARLMPMAQVMELRNILVQAAQSHLGTPYVYGGSRPGGFDCSGFTSYLYAQQGISLNRGASGQLRNGIVVPKEDLEAGDLVFFHISGPYIASHVGIYVGEGDFIHAASDGIRYSNLNERYYARTYIGARRIVDTDTTGAREAVSLMEPAVMTVRSVTGLRTAG